MGAKEMRKISPDIVMVMLLPLLLLLSLLPGMAHAGQTLQCDFKGVGAAYFERAKEGLDFTSPDGYRWLTFESDDFIQLHSSKINPDYVTNPFTVYLYDKRTKRIRQVSGAMRAAPMMADGVCQFTHE